MKIDLTIALRSYPKAEQLGVLETFLEAQTRVNVVYLRANPTVPELYASGVRYAREGSPELWKDIPTILEDGFDDCEGLSCWLAAELRVRRNIASARVRLVRASKLFSLIHAVVIDDSNPSHRWDPSRRLGMTRRKTRKAA